MIVFLHVSENQGHFLNQHFLKGTVHEKLKFCLVILKKVYFQPIGVFSISISIFPVKVVGNIVGAYNFDKKI